jgi:hypothetical protein
MEEDPGAVVIMAGVALLQVIIVMGEFGIMCMTEVRGVLDVFGRVVVVVVRAGMLAGEGDFVGPVGGVRLVELEVLLDAVVVEVPAVVVVVEVMRAAMAVEVAAVVVVVDMREVFTLGTGGQVVVVFFFVGGRVDEIDSGTLVEMAAVVVVVDVIRTVVMVEMATIVMMVDVRKIFAFGTGGEVLLVIRGIVGRLHSGALVDVGIVII